MPANLTAMVSQRKQRLSLTLACIAGSWLNLCSTTAAVEPRDLHSRAIPGCCWIFAGDQGIGAGWIVDTQRKWVVTSYHIVGDARTVDVIFPTWRDGKLLTDRADVQAEFRRLKRGGRVIKREPKCDLALIEMESLPETVRALPLAEQPAKAGERVHFIGNRRDLDQLWAYTAGQVRQAFRSEAGFPWRTEKLAHGCQLLAIQAAINEGDSGGPLLNDRGEVVGVTAAILFQAERSAAAIDVSAVRDFLGPEFVQKRAPAAGESRDLYRTLVRSSAWLQSSLAIGRASAFIIDHERRLLISTAVAAGPNERVELIFPKFAKGEIVAEIAGYKNAPRVRAIVFAHDTRRNLALLEAESLPDNAIALEPAEESARPGDVLHAVGNPNGIDALWLYAAATVRQNGKIQLSQNKVDGVAAVLVLQAPGSANDGGGPVVDARGKLVAVAGGKDGPEQQVSYAVDVGEVKSFLVETRPLWRPKTADEFHLRGKTRLHVRQLDLALGDFREALRLQPDHIPTLFELPNVYRLCGDAKQALAMIKQALNRLPPDRHALPLARRAELALDRNDPDAALKDCDAALKIDPKCAVARVVRGETWRRKKELAKALADADEAIWLDANLAAAYLARGRVQLDRRDWQEAVVDLSRAIELEPFDPLPLLERAKAYDGLAELKKAQKDRAAAERLK